MHLQDNSYCLLGTLKKDGSRVHTAVWFASDQDWHYIFSAGDAGKVKRLRNFSDVDTAPCTLLGKSLGKAVASDGYLIDDRDEIVHCLQLFTAKYGWQMNTLNTLSKLSGKYQQRRYIKVKRRS